MEVLECDDTRVVIMLPSGNRLFVHYFGEGEADYVMVHGFDSGDGDSPMNLDLIVPDPDMMHSGGPGEDDINDVHRVRVRHHGPADSACAFVPPEFIDQQECPEE